MLVADREQAFSVLNSFDAIQILITDMNLRVSFDLLRHARHRDAAFLAADSFAGRPDDSWIDIDSRMFDIGNVERDDAFQHADVRAGDSKAGDGAYRVEEVSRQRT